MTKFSHEEESLVAFLRQNRPEPPPAKANFEKQLMEVVRRKSLSSQRESSQSPWAISAAFAATVLLGWSGYRLVNYSVRIAIERDEQLETFIVNNWRDAINESTSTSSFYSPETYWSPVTEQKTKVFYSRRQ